MFTQLCFLDDATRLRTQLSPVYLLSRRLHLDLLQTQLVGII